MKLKSIVLFIFALLAAYSAYWYHIANNAENKVSEITRHLEERGATITYESVEVTGFPYRFIFSLDKPEVNQTQGDVNLKWISDKLNIYAQPWSFSHLIFTSNASRLSIYEKQSQNKSSGIFLDSSSMRLSYNVPKNNSSRISLELKDSHTSRYIDNSPIFNAQNFVIHIRPTATSTSSAENNLLAPKLADVALGMEGLTIGKNTSTKVIDELTLISSLRGTSPPSLSRGGLEAWRDSGGTLEISQLDIIVSGLDVKADGSVTIDQDLKPLGALSTRIAVPQAASEVVGRFINLDEQARQTLTSSLALLQTFSVDGGVPLSLTAQNGYLWLGPLWLTELPPIL
jgi:hypothetical protein